MKQRTWILRSALVGALLCGLAGVAAAFDHLEITVVNPHIVQGRPAVTRGLTFSVHVRAVNADGTTDTAADFINAVLSSPDVAADLPGSAYLQNGERQFDGLRFLAAGRPVRLRVADADDPSVPAAEVLIDSYDPVDRFIVAVPSGTKYVDTPITVTLTALDSGGGTVLNFRDNVVLSAAVGHFSTGPTINVAGTSFFEGMVSLPVTFWGTDPITRENVLTVDGTVIYQGQTQPAQGQAAVAPLLPGSLASIMLLLAGEQLTPGVSPGKSGTPNSQTSGATFDGVSVYAIDQHWNPVMAGPYPTIAWSCDDPDPGVVLPATAVMGGNPETSYNLRLIRAGTTRVTTTASGAVTATSRSDVVINPEGLADFEFDTGVWNPSDLQVTTIPFNIRIIARDANGNVFPLNGQVSLRARIGTADESADYILTSNRTFVNGQLDALVQVTKRGFSAYIIVDSGIVRASPAFQVTNGPCEKILMTFPGETWVNGLNDPDFSGNLGTPNPVTAGQIITPVTLRPVDRYNNLAPGNRNVTLSCPTGYFQLPDYPGNIVQISNPTEIRVVFRTATSAQVLRAQSSGLEASLSSPVGVSPAAWQRLVVRAPGETLAPGIFDSIEDDGKLGQPATQDAGVPFNTRVYATDQYWNPISDSSPALPMTIHFSSSDPAAQLPANPQQLNDNLGDFQVALVTLADPNRQTIVVTDQATGRSAFTTIPVKAGLIDHFDIGINNRSNPTPNDVLSLLPDHRAGSWLPNVTVIARDIFGNHIDDYAADVTLFVSHGTGILSPASVNLGQGMGSGSFQGAWRGPIQITRTGQDVRLFVREETYALTDSSNTFNVFADAQDYADLLLLLPGETSTPGIPPGKVGTPLPVQAGEPVQAQVFATDAWYNQVPARPQVHFASSQFFQMISANDQALGVDGSGLFDLYFKAAATHHLTAADLIQPAVNDTSTVGVTAGQFVRLMLLLPGETPQPGGPEPDGKIGTPTPQTASLEFDARIRGTDQFWNLVTSATERVHLASDDGSLTPTNPLNNDQPLVDGEIIMPVFLINPGYVTLTASALDHTDITGQSVILAVEQGATYRIETPATAAVGPPSTFAMTISLVDENGDPLPAANNWVTISALKANLEPASSTPLVTTAQLAAGTVTIANQAYNTVEDIVLRITDVSGRQSYSSTIHMVPNGLEYVVTVDASQTLRVGPPATFPVTVRLRDVDTQTIIREDRRIAVGINAAAGGPGQGVVGVTDQRLNEGRVTFQQSYTRAENIYVTVLDSTGLAGASPVFTLAADGYKRLQIVAPGEVVEPGIPAYEATGKSGASLTQRSGEVFPMTARAVDQYWNLADTTSVGNLRLVASDGSFSNPGNPDQNFVPFINGRRTFNGFLTDEGTVGVTIYDEQDLNKPAQTTLIPVDPPYSYQITVPAVASTGPVPGFQITVRLIDPVSGNVVPTASNRFRMTPLLPNQGAANGVLGIPEAQLIGGVCVLNTQSYSTVEDIIIRVDDDYGREAFSTVIAMQSGGLYYAVTLPDTAIVGPPTTFPLTVELIDSNTGLRVTTQDRLFNIQVMSAQTGLPGQGHLEVAQGMLESGYRLINQAYSRAEDIFVQIADDQGIVGVSNTCRLVADGFKRIQIVAPGETPAPGSLSGSGKAGAPLTQQAEVPFTLTVRAVDQFWNLVRTINDGRIQLASDGGQLDLVDADDLDAPFIGGSRDMRIVLGNPGLIGVFATDPDHPTVSSGRVDIPVNEAEYRIILPTPPVVTAGPPATFTLTVRLVNPETGERIQAGGQFEMTALKPDRSAATSVLGITSGTLVAGEAVIGGQFYPASESLVIRVRDSRGRTSYSDVLTVVPEGVRYAVDVPDTAIAGVPFAMRVRRVDIVTGQIVTSDDRSFILTAYSGNAPRPDPALTPAGVLADTVGTTNSGVCEIPFQSYDRAESIYIKVSDATGEQFFSSVIVVRPAPVSICILEAEAVPGQPLLRPLRPGDRIYLRVRASDASGNVVAGTPLSVFLLAGDAGLGSLRAASAELIADVNGQATCDLYVNAHGSQDLLIQAAAGDAMSALLAIELLGPPITTPRFLPEAAPYGDGYYVLPTTAISLTSVVAGPEPVQGVWFDVDITDTPLPGNLYAGSFTLAELGAAYAAPGVHTLRFFAEETGGVREAVKTVVLYTATGLTTDREITNRPNPFRAGSESTVILFQAVSSGPVNITIYDLYGAIVFQDRMQVTGGTTTQYVWDGRNGKNRLVGNGGYVCRIQGSGLDLRRKIAVVK
ncbi:MAG: hypothetical protein RBT60_07460 [Candidatus Krumholzibacteria bacterium]|jgi:hypothetical protein|nr:hypothetical protein [Candidatus Krumholzibacteria bacterium]